MKSHLESYCFDEIIDQEFAEHMDIYISESGMDYEYDFDKGTYLDSFDDDYKLDVILSNVLAWSKVRYV